MFRCSPFPVSVRRNRQPCFQCAFVPLPDTLYCQPWNFTSGSGSLFFYSSPFFLFSPSFRTCKGACSRTYC